MLQFLNYKRVIRIQTILMIGICLVSSIHFYMKEIPQYLLILVLLMIGMMGTLCLSQILLEREKYRKGGEKNENC